MSTTASLTGAETVETTVASQGSSSAEVEVASAKAGSSKAGSVEPKKQPKGKGKASSKSKKAKEEEGSDFAVESDGSESDDAGSVASSGGDEAASSVDQDEDLEDVIEEEEQPKKKAAAKKKGTAVNSKGQSKPKTDPLDPNLPPIVELGAIFKDLVGNVQGDLVKLCDRLKGRKLRVGTMCSGTESPLLALGLISSSLEALTGSKLEVEHIFSCEIEPFKQAYIERNFSPPLLFRDVTELGGDIALTAYGGRAAVPGGIDMLVAGTSCVDYSPLNTKQKGIDAKGESGRTFFGMLDYVEKHQPPIVILENVSNAPWDEVVEKFHSIKYEAAYIRLDTKHYYIPHTRSRGYLVAIPKSTGAVVVDSWASKVKSLARPCSSPLEAFLLPTDDPRIHRARQDLSTIKQSKEGVKRTTVDWIRCESRHAQAREEEKLGLGRPLTAWQDNGGPPTMPDGAWNDWASAQTERVLDLMDISMLRLAQKGTDVQYKSAIWNLSQNVDRTTASVKLGIAPCLTPNMIAYLASRGGPIVGVEALALQGLPIDELLLTRENTDQLADLAGNAMSSTVVGTAILAALSVAKHTLRKPEEKKEEGEDVVMEDAEATTVNVEDRIRGQERLVDHPVDLASFAPPSADLLDKASRSARKCICEGRAGTSSLKTYVCTSCGHSACEACKSRPEHHYAEIEGERLAPDAFEAEFKKILPMRFKLQGFSLDALKTKLAALEETKVPVEAADDYFKAIADAVDNVEFHFQNVIRRKDWSATFAAEKASLELFLTATGCEWRLQVLADPLLTVGSNLRKRLNASVARLRIPKGADSLLDGEWDISVPIKMQDSATVEVETVGDLVPSWRADLGLVDYLNEKRPAQIRIKSSEKLAELLDRSIDGLYTLEKLCGTACNSLHRRVEPVEEKPLYLFLDPTRSGEPADDPYVFAEGCDRLEYSEDRGALVSVVKAWRPPNKQGTESVKVVVRSFWTPLPASKIDHGSNDATDSTFATLSTSFDVTADQESCSYATNLLTATVKQAAPKNALSWARSAWHDVDLHHEGPEVFKKIGWMLAKIPDWDAFREWQTVAQEGLHTNCTTCCPTMPDIKWYRRVEQKAKSVSTTIIAIEDGIQAAAFEKALKNRPSPLLIHTRQVDDSFEFRVGLNAATLAHKALGSLPVHRLDSFAATEPIVSWRLKSATGVELGFGRVGAPRLFTLPSNKQDPQAEQPPHFVKVQLRPEQLRSLTWMVAQENEPKPWVEEEVSEAVLPQLGWHAEAKATREVSVRGGVLADEVGYGKTAITVGLISAQLDKIELPKQTDRIPIKATLIVIPPHLSSQWPSEIKKFTAGASKPLKVIEIKDVKALKNQTIEDFQKADIVVIADTVFKSPLYWPQLGDWSAAPRGVRLDINANRYFRVCVEEALEALPAQLERLKQDRGATEVLTKIQAARRARARQDDIAEEQKPSKRLKGPSAVHEAERLELLRKQGKKAPSKDTKAKPQPKPAKGSQVEDDPWGLGTPVVRRDWTQMKAPPLAIFSFNRIVIDEFTYAEGPQLSAIHSIRASSRWILSGTPPLKNFSEIKTIAKLLHVHLGVDDESEGSSSARDARSKEKTAAEQFHSFRDVHTVGWHKRRDEVAQLFLDQFARQNLAEIDEIPYSEEIVRIDLPAAEMAIYRELEHHLLALSTDLGKIQKMKADNKGDREVRLSEALGESKTPEEALIKRCSHFSLDMDEETAALASATHVCDMIVARRVAQLADCEVELTEAIRTAAAMHVECLARKFYRGVEGTTGADVRHFKEYLKTIFASVKDEEASAALVRIANSVGCEGVKSEDTDKGKVEIKIKVKGEVKGMAEFSRKNGEAYTEIGADGKKVKMTGRKLPLDEWEKSRTWILRQKCSLLQRLTKELIGRYRSKRYFECVRSAQRNEDASWNDVAILSSCGHTGPVKEVTDAAKHAKCLMPNCDARVGITNIVLGSSLGVDAKSGTFGVKLETLVSLIKSDCKKSDKILVFVQFDDLFDKVHEALGTYGISVAVLTGTATQKGKVLNSFQNPKDKSAQVLLLRVTDASASGANLTVANTAFFVSPLLTESRPKYKAFETQAIGRLRRYGQLRPVKIFRLLTNSTIDMDIFEERSGLSVEDVLATQGPRELKHIEHKKDPDFVLPKIARKEKVSKTKAAKKSNSDDDSEESDARSTDSEVAKKRRRPSKTKPATTTAAKSKGKGKQKKVDSSDEEDSDEEPKPKKAKKAVAKKKKNVPVLTYDDSDDEPVVTAGKKRAAARPAVVIPDSDDEEEEEAESDAPPTPTKSSSRAPSSQAPIPSSVAKSNAVASSSKAAVKPSPLKRSAPDSAGSSKAPAAKKSRSSGKFLGVFVPSPQKTKQTTLSFAVKPKSKPAEAAAEE